MRNRFGWSLVPLLFLLAAQSACSTADAPPAPEALRCEYLTAPLAIGGQGGVGGAGSAPRFSWVGTDPSRGARQVAYQVHVATTAALARSERPDVWDSGKIGTDQSVNVAYGGPALKAGATYFWVVRTWGWGVDGSLQPRAGEHGGGGAQPVASAWSEPAMFGVGLLSRADWQGAQWIGDATPPPAVVAATKDGEKGAGVKGHPLQGMEALPAPMLRREFEVAGPVRRAMLYISALGLYEARINGERVGDRDLAPEWTDYNVRVQYQGYDVTKMLRTGGGNAIGVMLADGWYAGRLGMAQQFSEHKWPRAVYGRQPRLIALLVIEMQDGTTQRVVTDGTWRSTLAGPIRSADLLDGQVEDARRAIPGWDRPGFIEPPTAPWSNVLIDSGVKAELVAQPNEPIRAIQEIRPVAVGEVGTNKWVFDLGQNMAGRCRLAVKGAAGTEVVLRHAEAVNDDGTIYTANLRGAPQVDRYTLAGGGGGGGGGGEGSSGKAEVFEPRLTYHGFRFVEVSGPIATPTLDDLRGIVVCSSSPVVGSFECSSPLLNKLWLNILWTQHANMMSVPTDCPQRDERLGWTGDIVAFGQTAVFNKDMAAFFTKWFGDVRDAQADDGRYPDIAPHPFGKNRHFTGVPAWGDVGVTVPWEAYVNYGDKRLLEEHFASAKRWVDWVHGNNPDLIWRKARHNDYNDWLNGDTLVHEGWPRTGAGVPNEILATAFFARSTQLLSEMARVLGKKEAAAEYAALHEQIRAALCKAFVAADGKMPGDTQAGYALALNFDLVPAELRPKLAEHLVEGIHKYNSHLSTGFHTSQRALLELTKAGHTELAYQLVLDTRFPSWGYSIDNGATTIWERWDGYVKGRGFQDPGMNSLNHWALGSVGEWLTRVVLGINPDPAAPGYAHFVLAPRPGGGLTFARGGYRSVRGQIESSWRVEGGRTIYMFVVPPNTSATVRLAAGSLAAVTEGGRALEQTAGVRQVSAEVGGVRIELGSGRYEFTVRSEQP